jgi:hypothetical protein
MDSPEIFVVKFLGTSFSELLLVNFYFFWVLHLVNFSCGLLQHLNLLVDNFLFLVNYC